jgi:hypothetical protein
MNTHLCNGCRVSRISAGWLRLLAFTILLIAVVSALFGCTTAERREFGSAVSRTLAAAGKTIVLTAAQAATNAALRELNPEGFAK